MTTTANSPYLASVHALHAIAALAQAPLRFGHSVRILRDGALAFPAMLAVIRSARESVCFENCSAVPISVASRIAFSTQQSART